MGWQDREYAKEPQHGAYRPTGYGGGALRPRSMVLTLIIVNVVVYLLCVFTSGPRRPIDASFLFDWAVMTPRAVAHGQVWRLFTSAYLHWFTMHIFMNMFALYMFGPLLERRWGSGKFFWVYTIAGVAGNVFYVLLAFANWLPAGKAAGASGCVLGILGAAAVLFPRLEVLVFGIVPVNIRVLAAILAGGYVLNLFQVGDNAGGDACHLAGLAFGVWFALRGDRWWSYRGRARRAAVGELFGGHQRRGSPDGAGFRERLEQRRVDAATVDRILDKVRQTGMASLSEQERRALAEATDRQRGFEQ